VGQRQEGQQPETLPRSAAAVDMLLFCVGLGCVFSLSLSLFAFPIYKASIAAAYFFLSSFLSWLACLLDKACYFERWIR